MNNDVIRMQQEAAQRVQRMQERARQLVSAERPAGRTAETLAAARPSPEKRPRPADDHAEHTGLPPVMGERLPAKPPAAKPNALFSGLGDDPEQMLLLLLAVLLVRNDADIELVLALLYLAM